MLSSYYPVPLFSAAKKADWGCYARGVVAGDPFDFLEACFTLRLKNGCAQDEVIAERRCHQKHQAAPGETLASLLSNGGLISRLRKI